MADDPDEIMRRFHKSMAEQRAKLHRVTMESIIDVVILRYVPDDKADAARRHLRDKFDQVFEMGKKEAESNDGS